MQNNFRINNVLERDSVFIKKLDLCQLRLINNKNFPWVILVPEIDDISEITDLNSKQYSLLCTEIMLVSRIIKTQFSPDKLNIATIGNVVRQMHIHIVARYKNDPLFPNTVWGSKTSPYEEIECNEIVKQIKSALQ
ncbi:MAG: HIT family protein [Rickettsiales bacterium]|nr:HIT family protein [Rickettsiales bacterium]MCA0254935.1 HIT family protein [Pseudomonadota bacterium]